MLIDTHAHLYWDSYKQDLNTVIQHTIDAGVLTIINVGVDVEKSEIALKQVENELSGFSGFSSYSTIGIHPHEAIKYTNDVSIHHDIVQLKKIYQTNTSKCIAVGECGLDYLFDPEFIPSSQSINQVKQLQRQLFQAQIELAKKLNLPLIVHCRDDRSKNPTNSEAWDEVLRMIGQHPTILHCYSGLLPTTKYLLQTSNFLVSFAVTITYPKNDYLRDAAKLLPLEKIVLETDCPFLPPQSIRGRRNEPSSVLEIARFLADLKGIGLKQVEAQTSENARNILNLD